MTESREPAAEIPLPAILVYAAPTLGVGFMFFFVNTYLMKFATDVLLITPATMAVIFGISRFWDAVSDPVAGYLSDRTRTRLGRRRPWLLVGAVPVGLVFVLIWSPPADLAGDALAIWMGTLIVLYYTGLTVVMMPHDSLGAELSIGYHDRNRVFGWRRFFFGIGGGIINVPVMMLVLKMPAKISVATSQLELMVASFAAVLVHFFITFGEWDPWTRGVVVGLGTLVGAQIGVYLAGRVSARLVLLVIAGLLLLTGMRQIVAGL